MNKKSLRQRIQSGESLVGTFCAIPHPAATEMVAAAGFDFLCLDTEHSAIARETVEDMLRAADVHGTPALVRVAGNTPELIAAALDGGAAGVVVPRVNTAAEAESVVNAARFPPIGERGAGPGRAAAYGGGIGGYVGAANNDLLVAVQIETKSALDNAAEISAVEGVDLVFIGPGDLSVSLDAFGDTPGNAARLKTAITTIVDTATAQSQNVGMFRPDAQDLAEWAQRGVSLFIINAESAFMMKTATATAATAHTVLNTKLAPPGR